jgi:cell division protein FtsQ
MAWLEVGEWLAVRALTRLTACAVLAASIAYGLERGGHLTAPGGEEQPVLGRVAAIFGRSAQTIRISGLRQRSPQTVLAALGVEPGSSLFGFDTVESRKRLENIDWVESAEVKTVFPNQLEIEIVEREPFAIWQRGGSYYVIDRTGTAMGMDPAALAARLPLVAGEGAQKAAFELVNQLASYPVLGSKLKGAARVGGRRWNLYFPHNVKIMLPEQGVDEALAWLDRLERRQGVLEKGIVSIDLRMEGQAVVTPVKPVAADSGPAMAAGAVQ